MQAINSLNYDLMNFIVAIIALLVALYSIWYTWHCNRRKITITNGDFFSTAANPPIARFEICNLSPVPVTIENVEFFSGPKSSIQPLLDYEPEQTYTVMGSFGFKIPDVISTYQYADILNSPQVVQPYSSLELGYYFDEYHPLLTIKVSCGERIHHFKKHQSFSVHFSNIQD